PKRPRSPPPPDARSSPKPAQLLEHRGIRAIVAEPVGPPGIVLIDRRHLDGFGERARFFPIAANERQRHQRDLRRLRTRPGGERRAIRGSRVVETAACAKQLPSYQAPARTKPRNA